MKYVSILSMLLAAAAWGQLSQTGASATGPVICTGSQQLSVTSAGTVQILAGQTGKAIRICGFVINSGGTATARLVQGQGASCSTSQTALTPAFKLSNDGNVALGGSVGRIFTLAENNALCLTTTGNADVGVVVVFAQF